MKARVSIEAKIPWGCMRDMASGFYIGECPPLGLAVQGESWNELLESMNDAINALFTDLFESGELGLFLQSNGWTPLQPLPQVASGSEVEFDVAFLPH
ncbi:MAG: hypothetical protein HYV07_21610 [Deltaproteobacteria bacterium]|nr:hypothetical protein [Deltaproteobacteria bacterium]